MIRGGKLQFYKPYLAPTTANGRETAWSPWPHCSDGNTPTSLGRPWKPGQPEAWLLFPPPPRPRNVEPAQPRAGLGAGAKPWRGPGGLKSPRDNEGMAGSQGRRRRLSDRTSLLVLLEEGLAGLRREGPGRATAATCDQVWKRARRVLQSRLHPLRARPRCTAGKTQPHVRVCCFVSVCFLLCVGFFLGAVS